MFVASLQQQIEDNALISAEDVVLVALSGGPDSTALLLGLFELHSAFGFELCAAHLNHMLRGDQADADQLWCATLCRQLDIPFRSARVDVGSIARKNAANLEETAREERYSFLHSVANELGAVRIAVGHTADDQAETVLMRLIRGAGSTGLSGMRMITGTIIRPMLHMRRELLVAYLQEKGVQPRTDPQNADERFSRVFVRKRLMPLVEQLNPSAVETISNTADLLAAEDDQMTELADGIIQECLERTEEGLRLDRRLFDGLSLALQRRVLRRLVLSTTGTLRAVSYQWIEAARRAMRGDGPGLELHGWSFIPDESGLMIREKPEERNIEYCYRARVGGTVSIKEVDKEYTLRIIEGSKSVDYSRLSGPGRAFLDAEHIADTLIIRSWQDGDRYQPLGAPGTQKLQDIFVNAKIDRTERASLPVFCQEDDIIWVSGFRIAEKYRITKETRRILSIQEV